MVGRWLRTLAVCLLVAVAGVQAARQVIGQAAPGVAANTVAGIRIEGNQRIEPTTILSYLALSVGDPIDADRINRSLTALFATGLFADVNIARQGNVLVVRVVENPVINRIAFEGNKAVDDKTLSDEVQLRPRVVFTRSRAQSDVQRIIQIYQRNGRFAVTVEPKVIELDQNRVDLVFEVNEGPVTGVRRISFIGNHAFSDDALRSAIQTKEARWWRFFSSVDTYDPDRLSQDQEMLGLYYLERGYADFRVTSAVAQLTPDGQDFFLTFTVEEGERYKYGPLTVVSDIPDLAAASLTKLIQGKPGDVYNAHQVDNTVLDLTNEAGRQGYAFVDIRPELTRDRDQRTVAVVFHIAQGPRVYVNRINVTGNVRTVDEVIRREFRISEGDAFNTAKVQRSVERIRALQFFDKVELSQQPARPGGPDQLGGAQAAATDRVDLNLSLRERSTGQLTFGFGYSTADKFLTDIAISETNLLGRGQALSLSLTGAARRQEAQFSFTQPYFLGRNISAGVDVFARRRDYQSTSHYTYASKGFQVRTGFALSEQLTTSIHYTLHRDTVEDVDPLLASRLVVQQQGTRVISAVGYGLLYDTRDDVLFPTRGYSLKLSQELAGLAAPVRYLKTIVGAQIHFPIRPEWVLSLSTEEGHVTGLKKPLTVADRFLLGGDAFRGFRGSGVSPRDRVTGDALGGTLYTINSIELAFPLALPSDLGVRGSVFTDAGTVTRTNLGDSNVLDASTLRVAAGFGVSWRSPLGLLRFDFAWPLVKEDFDKTQRFQFNFGTRF